MSNRDDDFDSLFGDDFDDDDDFGDLGGDFDDFNLDDIDNGGSSGGGFDEFDFRDDGGDDFLNNLDTDNDDFSDFDNFGDEDFDLDNDDFGDDFSDLDAVDPNFLDEEAGAEEREGRSPAFIIAIAALVLIFLLAAGFILLQVLQDGGPTDLDMTATVIVANNATQESFLAMTQTAAVENQQATETQNAIDAVATETANFEATVAQETANAQATVDAEALILQQTADAEALILQQTADAEATVAAEQANIQATFAAETAIAEGEGQEEETPEEETPPDTSDLGDVALTATAIANQLSTPLASTPLDGEGGPVTDGVATQVPNQLPQSGLFDSTTGGEGMGMILVLAFGLIGVIFGARRLRAANNREA